MATDESARPDQGDNPLIEAATIAIRADHDVNAVELEIADQNGAGFRTLLDALQALDAAARIVTAVARLKGATP
jgi:hypothetical protein